MKKMIGLALITVLLAIVFIYPGIAGALTNMDGFSPTSSAIPGNESFPAASASSFFDMFPLYIWIIFAVIILIIVILTLFLVLSPGKKKKGGMPQQDRGGKPGKGEKGRKPHPEATPQPFAPAPRAEEYNPNAMPPQGRMPRPVAGQPLSPRPMPRPMPQAQFEPQPAASFEKRPPQPQPRPMPVQPQAAAGIRPQPLQTPPVPPAHTPGMEPPSAQTRYIPPQSPRAPGGISRAMFKATNLSILPEEVKEGDPVTISVTVVNTGGIAGLYSVVFRINNVVENIAELSLGPGASQTTVCTVQKELEGEYYVEVEGLRGMFTVLRRAPASFQVSNLTIKPEKVKQGQPISIGFMVTNTGERPGVYNANLLIKGMMEASEDIGIEPGETKSVTFNIVKDAAGFFPVNVEGYSGRFVVEMDWKE